MNPKGKPMHSNQNEKNAKHRDSAVRKIEANGDAADNGYGVALGQALQQVLKENA